MSSLIPSGSASGTGSMTLLAPVTNSNQTATLPDATGTVMVSGNMPAFSAYQNVQQTGISNWTATKVTFDTELFDTNNNFSSSRFTPTVAGYYQLNCAIQIPYGSTTAYIISIFYKNGTTQVGTGSQSSGAGSTYPTSNCSQLVYLNGSSDYIEVYAYGAPNTGSTYNTVAALQATFFSGVLVRSA